MITHLKSNVPMNWKITLVVHTLKSLGSQLNSKVCLWQWYELEQALRFMVCMGNSVAIVDTSYTKQALF